MRHVKTIGATAITAAGLIAAKGRRRGLRCNFCTAAQPVQLV
jgi:hypothetical protein